MKFHLLKLIIWPVSDQFPPKIVSFEPGKVNVITGASRTGKSAIIPIIDYCLASSDCFIPIDTIRDYTSWYGIVFQTEQEQILVARKVPNGNSVSNEFYLLRAPIISIPNVIKEANEKTDSVKHILNDLSSVPYLSLDGEEDKKGYNARLGFRDLMALVFQTQDVVANQNILFYKTHAHEHRERLRNWFPYILGAETIEILVARQRLQEIEKRLNQLRKEFDRTKAISSSWMANMNGHLKVAKEYGLLEGEISTEANHEDLLNAAKDLIRDIPDHSLSDSKNIKQSNSELVLLEKEEEEISIKIGISKKRLNELNRLKSGLVDYGNSIKKRVDRLHISQWMEDIAEKGQACAVCGSSEHPDSNNELKKIASVFKKYEEESKSTKNIPTSFSREEERLTSELDILIEKKKSFQNRFDLLLAMDKAAQEEFQQRKNMFLFLGHLKASMETFESLLDGGEIDKEIEKLEKEYSDILKKVDKNGVELRTDAAINRISQGILTHLKTLDVEIKYREVAPKFVIKDLNISVLSNDDNWHFLAEIGSASNWVSFHIALMCAFQEHFLAQENSCVPSFVIFDQPSQVYFPKLKRQELIEETDVEYLDEDEEAVKNIFKTIANSVNKKNGAWQSIILDHAAKDIYGDIEGVHEAAEWRNGEKLIPEEWYK